MRHSWPSQPFSLFVAMMRQPGVVSKLGVAMIYSVTANLDKLAIEGSSGPLYLLVDQALVFVLLGMVLLGLKICVPVPFVIAVKRTSIIFTSPWGYLIRKERAPHWYRILYA